MPFNPDGTLRVYSDAELDGYDFRTRGVRDGSHPTETFAPDGSGCARKWFCNWENRFDVIKHLCGQAEAYTSGADVLVTRLLPQRHPDHTNWVCVKAEVTGFAYAGTYSESDGRGNRLPDYATAEITAQYEQVPYALATDASIGYTAEINRYVTRPGYPETPPQPSTEYLTFPGGCLKYTVNGGGAPNGTPIPFNVGTPLVSERVSAVWRRVPETIFATTSPLFARIYGNPLAGTLPWIGSVNKTALFGRPALTLLLESVEPNRRPDTTSATGYSYDIRYNWIYKPQTHLRLFFFDTKAVPTITNGYYLVNRTGTYSDPTTWADGDSLFHVRDHAHATNGLFTPT